MAERATYTDERKKQLFGQFLAQYRRCGNFKAAAGIVGVPVPTLHDWINENEKFSKRASQARSTIVADLAAAQIDSATHLDNQGRRDTKAGQFMLQRLDPTEYPLEPSDRGLMDGNMFSQLRELAGELSDEEREQLRAAAKARILGGA